MTIKDRNGEPLKEGFYYDEVSLSIIYFTGEYTKARIALFETRAGITPASSNCVGAHFCRLRDPEKYIESTQKDIDWMVEKMSKLEENIKIEEKTQDLPFSPFPIFMLDNQRDHGPFGKHPWKKDGGFVHPHKHY